MIYKIEQRIGDVVVVRVIEFSGDSQGDVMIAREIIAGWREPGTVHMQYKREDSPA